MGRFDSRSPGSRRLHTQRKMNGDPKRDGPGEEPSLTPTLAKPEAANRVGDALSRRVAESIDSTGKAFAVLAGLGAFFFAAGYFVEWQRYRGGGLPPEGVLPLVSEGQIIAAGARELAISVLFVGFALALLGFVFVRLARWTQGRTGRLAQGVNRMLARDVATPTAVFGALMLLIVPFSGSGVLVTAILTGLLYYGLLLIRRFLEAGDAAQFPLWRLALAVGVAAIVLSGARLAEFPERRPDVLVCLTNGGELEGDYLASDSDKILIRKRPRGEGDSKRRDGLRCAREREPQGKRKRRRQGKRPRLVVVRTSELEEMQIAKSPAPLPYERSLLDLFLSLSPALPNLELSCIPPECRWGGGTRIGPSSYL